MRMDNRIQVVLKKVCLLFFFSCFSVFSQEKKAKLVVGIIVDQMRAEYLYRFQDNFTDNGFKRLMNDGFTVKNMHYNYYPTHTGPGHASVYTGTTPVNHGIVGNRWFNSSTDKNIYCAEDLEVTLVDNDGKIENDTAKKFKRSPKNLLSTTITDELKLVTNERSKVIGISLKDRGAIFPSGHLADYAFWYNSNNGHFVTSSFYTDKLPKWLIDFNNQKIADSLLNGKWDYFLPSKVYTNSGADDAPFERIYKGRKKSTLPYNLKKLRQENGDFDLLTAIPQGNTLLTKLAFSVIENEKLGQNEETDMLTISYSSTDYVGHNFGIHSKEIEDTYIRLDREIGELLSYLDEKVGKGKYTLFLTADHAASENPDYLKSKNIAGGYFSPKELKKELNEYLEKQFGKGEYVSYLDTSQVYFKNIDEISQNMLKKSRSYLKKITSRVGISTPISIREKYTREIIIKSSIAFLKGVEGVKSVVAPEYFPFFNDSKSEFFKNGYHSRNSGDIIFHFNPGWMYQLKYGTSHGHTFSSDTHVPLLWYGMNIPKGESVRPHKITEIAPTLSFLLNIPLPNASSHEVIEEVLSSN